VNGEFELQLRFNIRSFLLLTLALALTAAIAGGYLFVKNILVKPSSETNVTSETISAPPYVYGESTPINFGAIKSADDAYIKLTLRFRVDDTDGYPNLFQTAPFNYGMRLEVSGSTAAIIVPDSVLAGDGLRVFVLTTRLKKGMWYTLNIEAFNASHIRATLNGALMLNESVPGLAMQTSQILVGGGFDSTRSFRGSIKDISLTKGTTPKSWKFRYLGLVKLPASSNTLILIFSFFVFLALVRRVSLTQCRQILRSLTNPVPKLIIASLFVAQAFLLFYFLAYRNVVFIFVFLFFIGLNLYLLITPSFFRERFFCFVLIPLSGLLAISIIGSYFIGFNIDIKFLTPTLLIVSCIGYVLSFKFLRADFLEFFSEIKRDYSFVLLVYTLVLTPIILILISPVLILDYSTSPLRVGPDVGSYTKMSQYLLDGGTWSKSLQGIGALAGMSAGEITRYSSDTMSWPFAYYFRWGLTAFQTVVTDITFSKHSFETAFVSMVVPYLLTCGLALIWIRKVVSLSLVVTIFALAAFLFNPNMLNQWYEGFYGSTYAAGFLIPIMYMFSRLRSDDAFTTRDFRRSLAFSSILFAACLFSYAESVLFIFSVLTCFMFIIDITISKSIRWRAYLFIFGSGCLGLIIAIPCGFIFEWMMLAIKQVTEEGGNGYPQPLWALPSEIFGLQNIYLDATIGTAGKALSRTTLGIILPLISSICIFYAFFVYFKNERKEENILYLASIIMIVASVYYVFLKTPDNNYTYMKMYIFHFPILFVLFWISLNTLSEKHSAVFTLLRMKHQQDLFLLLSILITTNGLLYISKYQQEAIVIEDYRINLHSQTQHINFDNVIMYPPRSDSSWFTMYTAIFSTPWMLPGTWKDVPYNADFEGYKVYLFIEKKPNEIIEVQNEYIVFENQYYLILDSGKTVLDGVSKTNRSMNFSTYTDSIVELIW
jgi:hypothetical protein